MRIHRPSRFASVCRTGHRLPLSKTFKLKSRRARSLALLGLVAVATTALASTVSSAGSLGQLILSLGSSNGGGSVSLHSQPLAAFPNSMSMVAVPQSSTAMAVERRGHTATKLGDGRVLIVGGENSGGLISQSEIFDPTAGTFSLGANLNSSRADHSATRLADGRVLIAGGRGATGTLTTTEIFDPATGAFAAGPAMSVARSGHSATLFADGRILIAGGEANGSAEIIDAALSSSTAAGSMSVARSMHSAALLQDGRVLIVGGRDAGGSELSSAEIFDTPAGTSSSVDSTLKVARVRAHLRVLFDGKVQIIGGSNDGSMEIYDPLVETIGAYAHVIPETDTCVGLPAQILTSQTRAALFHNGQTDPLFDRSGHTITEINGQALVLGGANSGGAVLNSSSVLASSSASITTDKLDYAPSETVSISGRGFQPGETVRIKIHEDPHTPQERGFDIVADSDGNFAGTYLVQSYDLYMKFIVGARGLSSGSTAQTTFTDAFKADLEGQSAVSTVNQTGTGTWIAGNLQNWQEQSLIPLRVHMTGGPIANQPITVQFDHTKTQGGSITPGIQNLTNFATSAGVTMTTPVLSAPAGQDSWSYTFSVTLSGSTGDVNFNGIMAVGANNFSGSSLALSGTPALGTLQISKPAPIGTADLSITKTGPSTANPSQTVTYTLSYLNKVTSPNIAGNTQITDTVPVGLSYVPSSCTGGCSFDSLSKTLTWNLGALAIGASGSVTFQATVTAAAGTTVTNTGLIQSSAADPNLNDNDSSVSTNITLACTAPNVTTQPTSQTVTYGAASASFTAAAGGSPTPTVQWQVQIGGVGSFTNLSNVAPYSGVTTGTLTITSPTVSLSGNKYQAVFTNTCGGTQTATSNAATLTVNPKNLTISGALAQNKIYDGTTTATVDFTGASPVGVVGGDTVNINSSAYSANFNTKDFGTSKPVTVTGVTLSGAQAGNYTVSQPSGLTANITAKALTETGLSASNKIYDATTTATLTGTAALLASEAGGSGTTSDGKPYTGDTVTITGTPTGTFASKDVANGISVTVGGTSLTGAQAGNYTLTQQTGLIANITAKALTVSGLTANNKIYDATTAATLSGTAALQASEAAGSGTTADGKPYTGDTVSIGGTPSGTFASKDVANGIAVTVTGNTISGVQASNYTLAQQTGLTANITPKALTVSGLSASNKIYDATTTATLSGTAGLPIAEAPGAGTTADGKPYTGDTVTVGGTPSGTFASKDVASGIAVTVSGNTIGGAQAANYTLTQQTGLTADITPKALTVSGLTANNKVYDATTTATLSGTAGLPIAEAPGAGTTADGKPYTGDTVTVGGTPSGTFASKDVANGIAVTVSGNTIGGAQAANYTLTQQTGLTADITTKALTVSGLSASNKIYDATTTATLSGTAGLPTAEAPGAGTSSDGKPYTGDIVSVGGTSSGTFASKDVANGSAVTVTGNTIGGAQASNYSLAQQTGLTADITPKALTVSGLSASNKTYDATTAATLSGTAGLPIAEAPGAGTSSDGKPYTGDIVSVGGTSSGTFASKDVANGIAVTVTGNT
ncbi:MAG: YDG domain-containing protein, partial [Pyrinomonadaceae bacterium]